MKPRLVRPDPRATGIVSQMDEVMSRERDVRSDTGAPRVRYLLCATPRCGSNLLSLALQNTGIAGVPHEYLNPRLMWGWVRRTGCGVPFDVVDYLEGIEAVRTTPNGVFGLKVHFYHLPLIWGRDRAGMLDFLSRFDHLILLGRGDKLAQAVSLYRAQVTQIWTSDDHRHLPADDPRLTLKVPFRPDLIANALKSIAAGDAGWASLLASSGKSAARFQYETFSLDIDSSVDRVLEILGCPTQRTRTHAELRKQGSPEDELLGGFRRYLGLRSEAKG